MSIRGWGQIPLPEGYEWEDYLGITWVDFANQGRISEEEMEPFLGVFAPDVIEKGDKRCDREKCELDLNHSYWPHLRRTRRGVVIAEPYKAGKFLGTAMSDYAFHHAPWWDRKERPVTEVTSHGEWIGGSAYQYRCVLCGWPWPFRDPPPESAECHSCSGELEKEDE